MDEIRFAFRRNFYAWLACWVDIACAISGLLTFGMYMPDWFLRFRIWTSKNLFKYRAALNLDT